MIVEILEVKKKFQDSRIELYFIFSKPAEIMMIIFYNKSSVFLVNLEYQV